MFAITILACSILHGDCREHSLTYIDEGQSAMPYSCFASGMSEVAKWQEAHPNWAVTRWSCGGVRHVVKI